MASIILLHNKNYTFSHELFLQKILHLPDAKQKLFRMILSVVSTSEFSRTGGSTRKAFSA